MSNLIIDTFRHINKGIVGFELVSNGFTSETISNYFPNFRITFYINKLVKCSLCILVNIIFMILIKSILNRDSSFCYFTITDTEEI